MTVKIGKKIVVLAIAVFVLLPVFVHAVDYLPLVPCGVSEQNEADFKARGEGQADWDYSRACTRCDAFKLTKNIIDFVLIGIVPVAAAVLFIAGGLVIVLAGARPEWIKNGKNIFWNTFIGLIVIFSSWIIVNTFIQSFGPDQAKDSWFRFTCRGSVITGPSGVSLPPGAACSNPQGLAQFFNAAYPRRNAPELDTLISCVNSRLGGFIDQSQAYTYETENSNVLCNYTRGRSACGACAHSLNSCHYGGPNGTNGSLAVDFNARGISEQELFNRLNAIRGVCNFGFIQFEDDHTHVSTRSCSADAGDRLSGNPPGGTGGGGNGKTTAPNPSITSISPTTFPAGREASFDQNTGVSTFTFLDVPFEIKGQNLKGTTLSSDNIGVDGKAGVEFKNLQLSDTSIKGTMLMYSTTKEGPTKITVRNKGNSANISVNVTIAGTQYLQREFARNPNVKFFGRWPEVMPSAAPFNAAELVKDALGYINKPSYQRLNILVYVFEPDYWDSVAEAKFCPQAKRSGFSANGCAPSDKREIYAKAEEIQIKATVVHEAAHKLHFYNRGIYTPVPSQPSQFQNEWWAVANPVIKNCNYIPIKIIEGAFSWTDDSNPLVPRCGFIWAYGASKVNKSSDRNDYFEDVATITEVLRGVESSYNPNSGDTLTIPQVYNAKYDILRKYGF